MLDEWLLRQWLAGVDHRRDAYRSSDWQRFLCPEARSLRDTGPCEDQQL